MHQPDDPGVQERRPPPRDLRPVTIVLVVTAAFLILALLVTAGGPTP